MKTYLRSVLTILGSVLLLSLTLFAQNGALKVTSFPSGANVLVDGVDSGKLTPMSISLSVGDHTVVVTIPNSGWNPDTRLVTIASGNNDLSVTLLPVLTVGPKGDKGDKGDPGAPGKDGSPGKDGAPGLPGTPGKDGAPGTDGAPGAAGPGGFNGIAGFSDTAFTGSWTAPPNITHVMVEMWGGGGGGGYYPGGGGAYSRSVIAVTPGATYDIIVGDGGGGGNVLDGTPSKPGQDSQFKLHGGTIRIFAGGGGAGGGAGDAPGAGGNPDPSAAISHTGFGGNLSSNAAFGSSFCPGPLGDQTGHGGGAFGGGAPGFVLLTW
jgi:hypothetical protein